MSDTGAEIVALASQHLGEKYVWGVLVPKNQPDWEGPWDCAEFMSWLIYQAATVLYGCNKDNGPPESADAFTGFWARDAKLKGNIISIKEAARTEGAAVLRLAVDSTSEGKIPGHIVVSDGQGGTIEAHSTKEGVIRSTLSDRRWDMGILVPGVVYQQGLSVAIKLPTTIIYRWKRPLMTGTKVRDIQRALKKKGFSPGPIDGQYGRWTRAAVVAFQATSGMLADGEVGPRTAKALAIKLAKVGRVGRFGQRRPRK